MGAGCSTSNGGFVLPEKLPTSQEASRLPSLSSRAHSMEQSRARKLSMTGRRSSRNPYLGAPLPWDEDQRLASLLRLGTAVDTCENLLADITEMLAHMLKVPVALISLVKQDTVELKAVYREVIPGVKPIASAPTGTKALAFSTYTLLTAVPEMLLVPDMALDARFSDHPAVQNGLGFVAACPLVTQDGGRIGALCVMDFRPRPDIDAACCKLMCNFAELAMRCIERAPDVAPPSNRSASDPTTQEHKALMVIDTAVAGWPILYVNPRWTAITGTLGPRTKGRSILEVFCLTEFAAAKGSEGASGRETLQALCERAARFTVLGAMLPVVDDDVGIRVALQFSPGGLAPVDSQTAAIGISTSVPYSPIPSARGCYIVTMSQCYPLNKATSALPLLPLEPQACSASASVSRPRRISHQALPELQEVPPAKYQFDCVSNWRPPPNAPVQPMQKTVSFLPTHHSTADDLIRSKSVQRAPSAGAHLAAPVAKSLSNPAYMPREAIQSRLHIGGSGIPTKLERIASESLSEAPAAGLPEAVSGQLAAQLSSKLSSQLSTTSQAGAGGSATDEAHEKQVTILLGLLVSCSVAGRVVRAMSKEGSDGFIIKILEVGDDIWQSQLAALLLRLDHPNILRTLGALRRPRQAIAAVAAPRCCNPLQKSGSRKEGLASQQDTLLLQEPFQGTLDEACEQGHFLLEPSVYVTGKPNVDMLAMLLTAHDIATAMHYLHKQGMTHGLLEAASIAIVPGGRDARGFQAKVSGFDRATCSTEGPMRPADVALPVGSLAYLAPELFRSTIKSSQAGDVYAFGVLLWVMYTAQKPWVSLSPAQIELAVVRECARLPFPPTTPPPLKMAAMACMAALPEARPTFATIMGQLAWAIAAQQSG